jgi:hypothetical protein
VLVAAGMNEGAGLDCRRKAHSGLEWAQA